MHSQRHGQERCENTTSNMKLERLHKHHFITTFSLLSVTVCRDIHTTKHNYSVRGMPFQGIQSDVRLS